jgi:hypothetical protein
MQNIKKFKWRIFKFIKFAQRTERNLLLPFIQCLKFIIITGLVELLFLYYYIFGEISILLNFIFYTLMNPCFLLLLVNSLMFIFL